MSIVIIAKTFLWLFFVYFDKKHSKSFVQKNDVFFLLLTFICPRRIFELSV